MTDLYLVTGFLGSGKTTFINNMVPLFAGRRLALLVNEFGREGVDGALLAQRGALLAEVTGGSIFCSCLSAAFDRELEKIAASNLETVIIESSGFSDPEGMFAALRDKRFSQLRCRAIVCLADAPRFEKTFAAARVLRRQLSCADVVVVNKTDLVTAEQKEHVFTAVQKHKPGAAVYETSYGALTDEISAALLNPQPQAEVDAGLLSADIALRSLSVVIDPSAASAEVEKILSLFAEDTYRVKGFLRLADGCFLADCVGALVKLTPLDADSRAHGEAAEGANRLSVLYGHGLGARKSIERAREWYPEKLFVV